MSTIPASAIVQILPGVISAGGTGLVLNGLMLTNSYRVPTGSVISFASAAAVGSYFGLASNEYAKAVVYFNGFLNSTQFPAALLVAQYTQTNVAAWMRSGVVSGLTIAQLQAISGTLVVTIDGYPHTAGALNLSSATSFTAAATLIQTALNASEPTEASVTASIAAGTPAVFVGTISNDVLTVTSMTSGVIEPGGVISGTGVTSSTQILAQLSGTTGGVGTYAVNIAQAVASATITETFGVLNVTVVGSGTLSVGQTVTGGTTAAGTVITALGTGTGLTGTYYVNLTQTVTSGTLTATATNCVVTYDSIQGSFFITSGVSGAPSSIAYATGTTATTLMLTSATGAVLSQGAAAATPAMFMAGITQITQNWATFFLSFEVDDFLGNTQKLAFAAWTSTTNYRYAFLCWDSDVTATTGVSTTCLGYLIAQASYSGTMLIYDPNNTGLAAFASGVIASINFNAINGRTNLCFRQQSSLTATVTNQQIAAYLIQNGYNFYGAYGTANATFTWLYNGSISGPFLWADSYVNQIWMNNNFQQALMNLLAAFGSIPYNNFGYGLVEAALMTPIQQAIVFGAIRPGVTLSSTQIAQVNGQAGYVISDVLSQRGWYLQVQPATPQVRAARTTPTILFWYVDGQSIQQITMSSLEVQ